VKDYNQSFLMGAALTFHLHPQPYFSPFPTKKLIRFPQNLPLLTIAGYGTIYGKEFFGESYPETWEKTGEERKT
jgi:hypothetical protein